MVPRDLNEWLKAEPFVPFTIFLSDGASFEVRHPEMLIVYRTTADVAMPRQPQGDPWAQGRALWPGGMARISLVHITRLEPKGANP